MDDLTFDATIGAWNAAPPLPIEFDQDGSPMDDANWFVRVHLGFEPSQVGEEMVDVLVAGWRQQYRGGVNNAFTRALQRQINNVRSRGSSTTTDEPWMTHGDAHWYITKPNVAAAAAWLLPHARRAHRATTAADAEYAAALGYAGDDAVAQMTTFELEMQHVLPPSRLNRDDVDHYSTMYGRSRGERFVRIHPSG